MRSPVNVEERANVLWVDDATRRTSYTKRAFMEHNNVGESVYIGISAGNWKQGLYNYRQYFSNPQLSSQTALSIYFSNLNDQGLSPPPPPPPQIKWKIVRQPSTAIASMTDVTCVSMKKLV